MCIYSVYAWYLYSIHYMEDTRARMRYMRVRVNVYARAGIC